MAEELFEDGYETIDNIDSSQEVIDQMTEYYREKVPELDFKVMDVRDMD